VRGRTRRRGSRIREAHFELNGQQVGIPCDRWVRLEDNVNAIALAIGALRGLKRWGAKQIVDQAFRGFAALPAGEPPAWWEVLEVNRTTSRQEVEAAYRTLIRVHYPDVGGAPEQFHVLQIANEAAKKSQEVRSNRA